MQSWPAVPLLLAELLVQHASGQAVLLKGFGFLVSLFPLQSKEMDAPHSCVLHDLILVPGAAWDYQLSLDFNGINYSVVMLF